MNDRLRRLTDRRHALEDQVLELVGQIDAIEATVESKRDRDPQGEDRRAEIRAEIQDLLSELEVVRADLDDARGRLRRTVRRLKKLRRRIRNAVRPKVIDLGAQLTFRTMTAQGPPVGTIGHYTAGPTDTSTENAIALWRGVHAQHLAQGWAGIGYQLGITRDGDVVKLRPFNVVGSHTLGHNTGQIGLSVHGTTGDEPTVLQRRALRWALKKFNLKALPATVHNDWMATGCPGSFEAMYHAKGKA